jgi:hypothetical protein
MVPYLRKISTRSYYSPDITAEYCRRPGQGLSLPLPQSSQSDRHPDANEGVHRRLSPSSEADSKCSSGQARRRIAVAVSLVPINTSRSGRLLTWRMAVPAVPQAQDQMQRRSWQWPGLLELSERWSGAKFVHILKSGLSKVSLVIFLHY